METQALDYPADDDDLATHRGRARDLLNEISRQAKVVLADQGIDLFFLVPNSGEAILIFGTSADPPDDLWNEAGKPVAAIVGGLIGLRGTRCRPVTCATTSVTR